jgi:hypothetical protein
LGAVILDHLNKPAQLRDMPTGGTERAAPLAAP